jgi:hypothetical protein
MRTKNILKGFIASLLFSTILISCDGYNVDLLNELDVTRVFSPIGLTAKVSNQTTVELNWTLRDDADHYVVEFSADDPNFTTIFKTVEVKPTELPVKVVLEGETVYSIRVKGVSAKGLDVSKWATTTATTLSEQLFIAGPDSDIQATQATVRWVANSNVTELVANPGNIIRTITASEKTAGVATITGLTGETQYTVTLNNGTKKRGTKVFTTGIDIGNGILVQPTDDLNAKVTAAAAGATLVLMPGNYTVYTGLITIDKPITIRGLKSYDKPKLHVNFSATTGATDTKLIDLDLSGDATLTDMFRFSTASYNYGPLSISGCYVHDYNISLVGGNVASSKVTSVTVDNTIVKNVNNASGGDFIDFRLTYVTDITVKNSTFNNCSLGRDFVRVDAATGLSGTGLNTNILIDACTLYNVSNTVAPKRILYVRFVSNTSTVKNTLIAGTTAIYSNQTATTAPTFLNNNYFNAASFYDAAITGNKIDASSSRTTLDPGFVSASTDNFTITNATLKSNAVGDPRWRQ